MSSEVERAVAKVLESAREIGRTAEEWQLGEGESRLARDEETGAAEPGQKSAVRQQVAGLQTNEGAAGEPEVEGLLARAERVQAELRSAEARAELQQERARRTAAEDAALRRAEQAEAAAQASAETVDQLVAKLEGLTDRLEAQEAEIDRLKAPEAELELAEEPEGELAEESGEELYDEPEGEPEPSPIPPPAPVQSMRPAWAIDINRVSFDELRGIGLSMNQAARFIEERERRGDFASVEDLDDLRGLPVDTIELLKRAAHS